MIDFIQYNNIELINIIKNGVPTLIDKSEELFPFESMTEEEKHICQNNAKARHLIMYALLRKKCQRCMTWSVLRRYGIHLFSHMKVQKR